MERPLGAVRDSHQQQLAVVEETNAKNGEKVLDTDDDDGTLLRI